MIFTICQSQAMAMAVDADTTPPVMTQMKDCQGSHEHSPAAPTCHGECQHVQQHPSSGNFHAGDACIAILAFWFAMPTQEAGSIALASLPPHDPVSDPPPLLRFQHFRE